MGSRALSNEQYTFERDMVSVFGSGVGANTSDLSSKKGQGVASITRTGAGAHTITLNDKWMGLLMASFQVISSASADDYEVLVVEELVSTSKTVKIAIFKGGTAADLQTTDKLLFRLDLSNSSANPKGY